jgi:hypothetical protein
MKVNDYVGHPVYGIGIVKKIFWRSETEGEVLVQFGANHGEMWVEAKTLTLNPPPLVFPSPCY